MAKPKPCKKQGCEEPKALPAHFCYWHDLERSFIDDQVVAARKRRHQALTQLGGVEPRATVPAKEWPAGHRWCSGCQSFVPLWYVQGSRCKACESAASYGSHIKRTYGLTYAQYLDLYQHQGGRCFICGKRPRTKRLAVDHDHNSGLVRGLLCSGDRSCNHDVLGNIKDLKMAVRIVEYLLIPPAVTVLGADNPRRERINRDPHKYANGEWKRWPVWEGRYAATGAEDAWSLERALPDILECGQQAVDLFLSQDRIKTGLAEITEEEWVNLLRFGESDDSADSGDPEFPEEPQEPISGPEPADWRNDPAWS